MAVSNSLTKQNETDQKKKLEAVYMVNNEEVKLSPSIVKNYLVSGNKENVSMTEIAMFINLCKYQKLNPWLKEAYCIKYGSEPATVVVGKEAFMKRAEDNPNYDGDESGIIVVNNDDGSVRKSFGAFKLPNETIVGGWAEVWRKDRSHSKRVEVSFDEYAMRKKDGSLNKQWSSKPATMIRKVALVQALREAFPQTLGGMYTAEEQGIDETAPIEVQPAEMPITEQPKAEDVVFEEVVEVKDEKSIEDALFGDAE